MNETAIELRVVKVADLFDPFDPFPLPSRDLSGSAEAFIVGWARELPLDTPLRIVVHLPDAGAAPEGGLQDAFARHFEARALAVQRDLNELFRNGRVALLVGLSVLVVCTMAARFITAQFGGETVGPVVAEGLVILGWVANWRPIEIFLYDWWPLRRRRRLFERLAAAPVDVRAS